MNAGGALRDAFLLALDHDDPKARASAARTLTGCGHPLPSVVCSHLGLPAGSSYAAAARQVLNEDAATR